MNKTIYFIIIRLGQEAIIMGFTIVLGVIALSFLVIFAGVKIVDANTKKKEESK